MTCTHRDLVVYVLAVIGAVSLIVLPALYVQISRWRRQYEQPRPWPDPPTTPRKENR